MPSNETPQTPKPIYVRFFGNFQVVVDDVLVNQSSSRARRPWSLMEYLMVSRHKTISRQQLLDALWPDGASEQPEKALKNLVYRARSAFAARNIPYAQDVVLYRGGNYLLNNDLPWVLDYEQFDHLFSQAMRAGIPAEESIEYGLQAIGLYQGDFLSEQIYEDWVLPYNTHYRSQFFKCVAHTLELLEEAGRDADIEFVCNQALNIDQFEEELHIAYMNALVRQNKKSTALAHYNKLADMFFREMGVTPCDELREMYHELSHQLNNMETDLYTIKDALREQEASNNAFYCDFEVFRSLYRLEARAAERAGQAVFVGLLTLQGPDGDELPEGEDLTHNMTCLLEIIHASLRRGDVVSRFSLCQYILMLPTITLENAERVLARVADRYRSNCQNPRVQLDARIQPLNPVMEVV